MIDVTALLDALDRAVATAAEVLTPDEMEEPAAAARDTRQREGFLGGTLVVALAGGTGSGKSSLLNTLAGAAVASVSPVRPHTDEPLAWVPAGAEPNLRSLLDAYGISRQVEQKEFEGLAIVDLPDHDSIVADHRTTVGALLPRVDAVVWVLDPEKYRDPILYDDYLLPMRGYQRQFVFVLNQIDRIAGDVDAVVTDVRAALREAGLESAPVYTTAADPHRGAPLGIGLLADHLRDRLDAKQVSLGKLVADVRGAAASLTARSGLASGAGLDFDRRWADVRAATAEGLETTDDPAVLADTLCRLEDFVAAISVEVGGAVGRRTRAALPPETISRILTEVAQQQAGPATEGRRRARREAAAEAQRAREAELDDSIAVPLRELLWDRAVLGAALAGLGVELARAEAALA